MSILGIDPGAGGALALLAMDGKLIEVVDTPVIEVAGKRRIAAAQVATLIARWRPQHAIIERVGAMPGQGVSSMFAFGYAAGLMEGAVSMAGVPVSFAQPAVWKRAMAVTKDKGACRQMAQRLWPAQAASFDRVKDDGRAEAALLALHGLQTHMSHRRAA